MDGEIVFYTHDNSIELGGALLRVGELTADMLNLTPEEYAGMHEMLKRVKASGNVSELDALDSMLRRYKLFTFMDTWQDEDLQHRIGRYDCYLHDIRVFNTTIQNFIQHLISHLRKNDPGNYAAALHDFYTEPHFTMNYIVTPLNHGLDCYTTHDTYMLSYVPRELPDGSFAICEEHVTDSVQAVLKADYMHALNVGHNILRCKVCDKYFLLSGGAHALYCEGICPYDQRYTCRQFGSVKVQKELARDVPKIQIKVTAFERINQDMRRGAITRGEARVVKDYVRDRLYEALRRSDISLESFEQMLSSEAVYAACGVMRKSKPRGRPKKQGDGAP